MNKLFEQRMQKLLQNDYPAFESALNQKPIKSFYLNPLKHGSIEHLNSAFLTKHPYINDAYFYDYENYQLGKHPYFKDRKSVV